MVALLPNTASTTCMRLKRLFGAATRSGPTTLTQPTVLIREPTYADADVFISLMRASRHLHVPWIYPPATHAAYEQYMARLAGDDHFGFLLYVPQLTDDEGRATIVGVVNINNVIRGAAQSGSLGYYACGQHQRRGYMTQGLALVIEHAFATLGLHRLEANIQPANARSKALVQRLGFSSEGVSPRFLFIDGAWRDHERWALIDERAALYR